MWHIWCCSSNQQMFNNAHLINWYDIFVVWKIYSWTLMKQHEIPSRIIKKYHTQNKSLSIFVLINHILITSTYWAYYIHEFYRLYCVCQCNYFFRLSWCWGHFLAIIISKPIRKTYTFDIDLPYVVYNNMNRFFCISLVHFICVIKVLWLSP